MTSPLRQYRRHPSVDLSRYRKFVVAGRHVGWVSAAIAKKARAEQSMFSVDSSSVRVRDDLGDCEARTNALAEVLERWRGAGLVPGWRGELYPVNTRFADPALMLMERAAAPLFGVLCYGINVNGLTELDGRRALWVARRSARKQVDPLKLDVIVGGGQPFGLSVARNLVKECREEAGIPEDIARTARPCGLITLMIEAPEGLRVGQQFNFDLSLPRGFNPRNTDGEVDGFIRWSMDQLLANLSDADEFMFDVALVMIDLLIRKGAIGPDHPDYLDLVAGLRRPIPFEAT